MFSKPGSTASAQLGIEVSQLPAAHAKWAQQQLEPLSKQFGVTLSNIAPLSETVLKSASSAESDTTKKLSADEITTVVNNIAAAAAYAQTVHAPNDIGCSFSVLTCCSEECRGRLKRQVARALAVEKAKVPASTDDVGGPGAGGRLQLGKKWPYAVAADD